MEDSAGADGSDDVNQMLLATTTASTEGIEASERWMTRKKRREGRGGATLAALPSTRKKTRPETSADVDTNDDACILVDGTVDTAAAAAPVGACASPPGCTPEIMVQELMEYVMTRELGGRQNASHGDAREPAAPERAVFFAETATIRPAALYQIYHTVYGGTSTTQSERAVEAIVRHRRRLYGYNYERDLVGGFVNGSPRHTRRHLLTLVVKGLRCECIDASLRPDHDTAAKMETMEANKSHAAAVLLFDGVQKKSLSSFLKDSSGSSSDDDSVTED